MEYSRPTWHEPLTYPCRITLPNEFTSIVGLLVFPLYMHVNDFLFLKLGYR